MQGCRVCQISYKTNADLNKKTSLLANDSLMITCGLISTDNKRLHLLLRFYGEVRQQHVNYINWTIIPEDNISLNLDKVTFAPEKYRNTATFEANHTGKSFAELSDDYKLTSLGGKPVYYDFDYVNGHPIRSNKMNISLEIKLENGKIIRFRDDFLRQKQCYFAIH
jgi:hypothetical protein